MKKKYLLILFIIEIIVSVIISTIITIIITNKLKLELKPEIIINTFKSKIFYMIFCLLNISFIIITCYEVFIKSNNKIFGNRSNSNLYGHSRFLNEKEINKNFGNAKKQMFEYSNLENEEFSGIILKSINKRKKLFLNAIKKEHSLIVGSTGSGKTSQVIIPTILANAKSKTKSSMLVYDLKGNIFKETSKFLQNQKYNIITINLKEIEKSMQFNPLHVVFDLFQQANTTDNFVKRINLETRLSGLIDNLAYLILPSGSDDSNWLNGARSIFIGIVYAMLEDTLNANTKMSIEKFNFIQISNILNNQSEFLIDWLKFRPIDSKSKKFTTLITDNASEKTRDSYLSTLRSMLSSFITDTMAILTAKSSFSLNDIIKKQTIIYIIFDDTIESSKTFCSIIMEQVRNTLVYLAESDGKETLDRTWYFLLDEFANMPKINGFNKWLATDRSRNLFYCLPLQGISQLENIFNSAQQKELLSNCGCKIYLKAADNESIENFKKLFGEYTLQSKSVSLNADSKSSTSTSLTEKSLINYSDLAFIKEHEAYIIKSGIYPFKSEYVPFYKSSEFELGTAMISNDLYIIKKEDFYNIDFSNQLFDDSDDSINNFFDNPEPQENDNQDSYEVIDENPIEKEIISEVEKQKQKILTIQKRKNQIKNFINYNKKSS